MALSKTMAASVAANRAIKIAKRAVGKTTTGHTRLLECSSVTQLSTGLSCALIRYVVQTTRRQNNDIYGAVANDADHSNVTARIKSSKVPVKPLVEKNDTSNSPHVPDHN